MDESAAVNAADIGIALIVLLSALIAYGRGFAKEVLWVGGLVGAIFATIYGFPYAQPWFQRLDIGIYSDVVALGTIFVVSLVVCSTVAKAVSGWIRQSPLAIVDRSLGFLFGVVRGAAFVCLAFIAVEWTWEPDERPEWLKPGRSRPVVEAGATFLKSLVPMGEDTDSRDANAEKKSNMGARPNVLHDILNPAPRPGNASEPGAYDERQRRDMQRLIETK